MRIAVNDELGALEAVIPQAVAKLAPGGRLAIITFHSLEDRIVKQTFARMAQKWIPDPQNPYTGRKAVSPLATLVTRKPIVPSPTEIKQNPRSRSAKLRTLIAT